jgi:hypothetical protein
MGRHPLYVHFWTTLVDQVPGQSWLMSGGDTEKEALYMSWVVRLVYITLQCPLPSQLPFLPAPWLSTPIIDRETAQGMWALILAGNR